MAPTPLHGIDAIRVVVEIEGSQRPARVGDTLVLLVAGADA